MAGLLEDLAAEWEGEVALPSEEEVELTRMKKAGIKCVPLVREL